MGDRLIKIAVYIIVFLVVALVLFYLGSFTYLSLDSKRSRGSTLKEGRLGPCPGTPNCVLSEEKDKPSYIEPFPITGNAAEQWAKMKGSVIDIGGKIEADTGTYLWATFRTRFWRFVDDLELRLDEKNGVIHVRSASRVGKGDMGMNRKRVEELRKIFNSKSI